MNITIIAAIGNNKELGLNNKLLWNIPEDMQFFKENTIYKPIVMGINTLNSLPKLLPNRKHIVLTHQDIKDNPDIVVCHSLKELLDYIKYLDQEVMIIGGAKVYSETIDYANKMLLTEINSSAKADTFFPQFNKEEWDREVLSEHQYNDIVYKHVLYKKIK